MKSIKRIIFVMVAILTMAMPASAQFKIGVKAGIDVNEVNFDVDNLNKNFDSENRTGWTAGLTSEFTVPIIGLGFDLSVMYVHRENAGTTTDAELQQILTDKNYRKQDFIEIPLNLKYKLSLPVISKIVVPYVTTGPSVAFKCSKEAATAAYKDKKFDAAWNVGGGVQLLEHLQVGVNYGWGMTKSLKYIGSGIEPADLGKNNGWKITAAYFF